MFSPCKEHLEEHTDFVNDTTTFNTFTRLSLIDYARGGGGSIPKIGRLFDNTRYIALYSPEFDSLTRIGRSMDEIT